MPPSCYQNSVIVDLVVKPLTELAHLLLADLVFSLNNTYEPNSIDAVLERGILNVDILIELHSEESGGEDSTTFFRSRCFIL